jgi:hypothetical protein
VVLVRYMEAVVAVVVIVLVALQRKLAHKV